MSKSSTVLLPSFALHRVCHLSHRGTGRGQYQNEHSPQATPPPPSQQPLTYSAIDSLQAAAGQSSQGPIVQPQRFTGDILEGGRGRGQKTQTPGRDQARSQLNQLKRAIKREPPLAITKALSPDSVESFHCLEMNLELFQTQPGGP